MQPFTFALSTGTRSRGGTVLYYQLPQGMAWTPGDLLLQMDTVTFPGQITNTGELLAILPDLSAGARVQVQATPQPQALGVELCPADDSVAILVNGEFLAAYHYAREYAKPFLAPIVGPYGDPVTRPINPAITEHPHHRGLFLAHGSVNEVEIWNEPEDHGVCVQTGIHLEQGAVAARLTTDNVWQDAHGKALMADTRSLTIYALPSAARIIDVDLLLKAEYGDVVLGATKEAGFLGLRMHPDINVSSGKGGQMENSYGAVSEAECWSKKAHWCDYHGAVNGHRVGVAILDNAANLRFPTHWHIRDYGLFAVNPWYWAGDYTLPAGEMLRFRYRVIVHAGDAHEAGITERYLQYDLPPIVEVLAPGAK